MGHRGPMPGTPAARRGGHSGTVVQDRERSGPGDLPDVPLEPPDWLPGAAAEVWRATAPLLAGIATAADVETLAAFCLNVATIHANASTADDLRNPERIELVHAAQIRLERAAAALGLTPASRARIPRAPDTPPDSPFMDLIRG